MKKILAVMISVMMLLGVFTACGNQAGTGETTGVPGTPVAAGMLVLNANAAVNISYDADGLVLSIEGIDNNGSALVGEYTNYLGKTVTEAVCDLIGNSFVSGMMEEEGNYIMIKQAIGSALPGSNFLENIVKDAEGAVSATGSAAAVILVTEENLDENGYIDLETAKLLMLAHLALDSYDTLDGTVTPIEGFYGFTITAGDLTGSYIIDAVTGDVFEGELEGAEVDPTEANDEPAEETAVDETNAQSTEAAPVATETSEAESEPEEIVE